MNLILHLAFFIPNNCLKIFNQHTSFNEKKKNLGNKEQIFEIISLLFKFSKKNNDIIDLSLIELENYYRLDETFIIIECSTNDIIKILVETRKKKVHFNFGYTFKTRN